MRHLLVQAETHTPESLTRYEWIGLESAHNLADGHARQAQTAAMHIVVDTLGDLYRSAERGPQSTVQADFEERLYRLAGQHSVLTRPYPVQHHYSSSLSIEIVANYLRAHELRLGLLHPTFDNIPGIMRRHGIQLIEVDESVFESPSADRHYVGIDALFLVTPNNPTGLDPDPKALQQVIDECRYRGLLLILDFSFRHFSDHLGSWDQYEYLDRSGVQFMGIEDTGKTWPTLDLKVGSLIASASSHDELQRTTDDLLLNVSPFIFTLISKYIDGDQVLDCVDVARANRATLATALQDTPAVLEQTSSPMSVGWVRVPDTWQSSLLTLYLSARGISVLPGGPFFWNRPELGERFIRVALMRPQDSFALAARTLADAVRAYRPDRSDAEQFESTAEVGASGHGDASTDGLLLSNPAVEEAVLRIAREIVEDDSLTTGDDFFTEGGDSIAAMHLMGRLSKEFGARLRVRLIFENPRLADLAHAISAVLRTETTTVAPTPPDLGRPEAAATVDAIERMRQSFAAQVGRRTVS